MTISSLILERFTWEIAPKKFNTFANHSWYEHWQRNCVEIAAKVFRQSRAQMDGWWWWWWWWKRQNATTHLDLCWCIWLVGWLASILSYICKSVLLLLFRSLSVYSVSKFKFVGIQRLLFVVDSNASDYVNWIFSPSLAQCVCSSCVFLQHVLDFPCQLLFIFDLRFQFYGLFFIGININKLKREKKSY